MFAICDSFISGFEYDADFIKVNCCKVPTKWLFMKIIERRDFDTEYPVKVNTSTQSSSRKEKIERTLRTY